MSTSPLHPNPAAKKLYDSADKSLKKNNLLEAESYTAQAIALDETNAAYWLKLGVIWGQMNRHGEAIEANTMALALAPHSADALYNLGLGYMNIGDEAKGMDYLAQSYRAKPSDDLAEKLAAIFQNKKDYKSSAYYLLQIYKTKKAGMKESLQYQLAQALYYNGDLNQSLGVAIQLVKRSPQNNAYNSLLFDLYRRVPHTEFSADAKNIVTNLMKKETSTLLFLRNPWVSLFLLDPAYESLRKFVHADVSLPPLGDFYKTLGSEFLCLGLQSGLAVSIPIETILTNVRRHFLLHWQEAGTWPEGILKFISALAVGCWYNDFVYYETPEEKAAITALKAHVTGLLATGNGNDKIETPLQIALLACYVPLCEVCAENQDLPIAKKWQRDMDALITAQLTYPRQEKKLMADIPAFCTIDDATSVLVSQMYAARPYPRWISTNTSPCSPAMMEKTQGLEILVAGCGTGHEPTLYANVMGGARITAIDLSPPSIAYGKRMAIKLGLDKRIDFFHGDLMKVGDMGKRFDFVASSGVLHHLKEPEKGLAAILTTLKPNGRLSISLYSKSARDYVLGPASEYITQKGYSASTDDMRQFRRDVMHMTPDNPVTRCTSAGDFFFLSECNDLLFHVQEHRYTPHMIWDMAERHNLVPFHVSMTSDRLKAFQEMFPGQSPANPDLLEKFEEAHPKAFIEMYKVFFHRKGEDKPHVLDDLIKAGNL